MKTCRITAVVPGRLVETWYDRKTRSYVTQTKHDGNQVGAASYDGYSTAAKQSHAFHVTILTQRLYSDQ